ncbi:hypothetical protein [Cytobacillus oceanisediminis]
MKGGYGMDFNGPGKGHGGKFHGGGMGQQGVMGGQNEADQTTTDAL